MHDWVFLELHFLWHDGSCNLKFKDAISSEKFITCIGVRKLTVPRQEAWGESVCVNKIRGPIQENGFELLKIEMQSGDQIIIEAAKINMPEKN